MIILTSDCWGFTITEPKTGAVFHPGDTVVIKAKADTGENIKMVFLGAIKQNKGTAVFVAPYEISFTIDPDFIGVDTILASAKLDDNRIIETRIQITVELPSSVVLRGIAVDPTPVFLYKIPAGSEPNKVSAAETDSIGVSGIYSDGVKREITSSASGTVYASSDERVVKVSPEGELIAQAIGTAKITVRNGQYSAEVRVVVKPYRK
jgi:hypothetical protein